MANTLRTRGLWLGAALTLPLLTGARGGGCESAGLQTPAPDMTGSWDVEYDDQLEVEITVGGAVYSETLGAAGGTVDITHRGKPLSFDLDCAREAVICPSEVWPTSVTAEHRNEQFPHRVWMTLPLQRCEGRLVPPEPEACGQDTTNPACDEVCEGEVQVRDADRFGVINAEGDGFELLLGAGIATNGFNCVLLGTSVADADLQSQGSAEAGDWEATVLSDGSVATVYSGGCLWAGDPDMDNELEALVLGARVRLKTGFSATKR